jgi:RNA ligase
VTPEQYFKINSLWDLKTLRSWAEHNSVYVIESSKFPDVVMLHYKDECQYNNFWPTFARISRGTILDMKNQKVLAFPFEKFFSLDQMPETSYEILKALGPFEVSEKLDGSMGILYRVPSTGEYRITTKGSLESEHGEYATSILPEHLKRPEWVEDYTLMFEIINKKFQIVVDYSKKPGYNEGLYLIGARKRRSHQLCTYSEVQTLAKHLNLPTFKTYEFNGLDQLIALAKDLPVLEEGFVLRFKDDLMVKVKGSAYLAAHRFISHLSDRNILAAVADGTASTLVTLAPEEYREDIEDKIVYFQKKVADLEKECYTLFDRAPKESSRKAYAFWVQRHAPSYLKGFLFKLLDGKQVDRKQMFKVLEEIDNIDGRTRI